MSAGGARSRRDIVWRAPGGEALSCREKIKVLNENLDELEALAQDAFEDAILMGGDEAQIRAVLRALVDGLEKSVPEVTGLFFLLPPPLRGRVGVGGAAGTGLPVGPPTPTLPREGGGSRFLAALISLAFLWASAPARAETVAVLQGLDKTTARISRLEAPVDRPVRFGTLTIAVRACRKRPPEETPESAAFLEIDDQRPGDAAAQRVFSGWMFASSPALSAMEHPVYDVGVLDCRTDSGSSSSTGK